MDETERFDVRAILYGGGLAIILMLLLSAWAWPVIPEGQRVAIHWGLSGQPNGYAPKYVALFLLPALVVLVDLVIYLRLSSNKFKENLARSRSAILTSCYGSLFLIAFVHGLIVLTALGYNPPVWQCAAAAVGLLLFLIGALLAAGKVMRNNVVGIRTPWTLADDETWDKTNRLGGWILGAMGLLAIASALLSNMLLLIWSILAGAVLIIGGTWAYSYFAHQH
jgi:uncharacterized membrane protein